MSERAETFMRRALALARRGAGKVSPNPMVGCVLVRGGQVVGEGWHRRCGGPHAEVAALRAAGPRARGAAAFVTLEPCAHFGKTPPCVDALVNAGVSRVVCAMRDPNPRVDGKGLGRLQQGGLPVESGLLEAEARELNRAFVTRMERGRPYVILKAAVTLDGKMATATGRSQWITSRAARAEGHRLRAAADAILVGVGTVLADDPALTSHGRGRDPIRVVLDARRRTPRQAKVLRGPAPTLIFTANGRNHCRSRWGTAGGQGQGPARIPVPHAHGRLDLKSVLKSLADRGVGTLLVEGGSEVHTSFLKAGLADELRLFVAPKLVGGRGAKTFFGGAGVPDLARALALNDMRVRRIGPDLLISGRL